MMINSPRNETRENADEAGRIRVSVLIPVYNAGDHLRHCLDSLAAQTYCDFEAIALDDGSTDGSLERLRDFATTHPFLHVETQANAGAPITRNRLLKMARGEFIMFMDDDDDVAPDYIGRFVAEAEWTGADIVCGGYRRATTTGRTLFAIRAKDEVWSPYVIVAAWAKIWRRDFVLGNGIEFFNYGLGGDIPFSLKGYALARKTHVFDYVGYTWIDNEASVSNVAQKTFNREKDPLVLLGKCLEVAGCGNLVRRFCVRYAVWYLCFAGRGATPSEFVAEADRIFAWLAERGIKAIYPFSWHYAKAGDFKSFAVAAIFTAIRRLGLTGLFARIYCKGRQPPPRGPFLTQLLLPPRHGDGLASDTFWNALSNAAAAVMSFVLLILTSHLTGAYWCGVAALGLAMSQQLFPISNFCTGSYQASDIAERHSFSDYVAAKMVTVVAMLAYAAVWLLLDWRGPDKALAFLSMLLYQVSDGFSNAFFSRYQQKGRLDASCRIRFAKIVAFLFVFAAVLFATRRPLPAMAAASAAHASLFFVLDIPMLKFFGPLRLRFPGRSSFSILAACAPLAINYFLIMLVNNEPRFAVDEKLGECAHAAYSALFMVSFAIVMCADFLMNPQVARLAAALRDGNRAAAVRTIRAPLATILLLGALGIAGAWAIGIPILSFLFSIDLSGNAGALCILLCGGIMIAIHQLAQTILVVLRRQIWVLPGMLLATMAAVFASRPLVARLGLQGAAISYASAIAVLALCSAPLAIVFLRSALRTAK